MLPAVLTDFYDFNQLIRIAKTMPNEEGHRALDLVKEVSARQSLPPRTPPSSRSTMVGPCMSDMLRNSMTRPTTSPQQLPSLELMR